MAASILGLRTTIYKVADLEAAKKWYGKAFDQTPYFDEHFYVGFNIGGFELGLMPDDMPSDEKTSNVLTYWGVEDLAKAIVHFVKLGATIMDPATNVGGQIVVATVSDPFGNAIGLIYNPEFKSGR